MKETPAQSLRTIQSDLSRIYIQLDSLYRYHQSRRMSPIVEIQADLERANGKLADLIANLQNAPGPTPREIEERGYL